MYSILLLPSSQVDDLPLNIATRNTYVAVREISIPKLGIAGETILLIVNMEGLDEAFDAMTPRNNAGSVRARQVSAPRPSTRMF